MRSGKLIDDLPKQIMTGDPNFIRINIDDLNHVQDEGEVKDQEDQINLIHVVHDKERE